MLEVGNHVRLTAKSYSPSLGIGIGSIGEIMHVWASGSYDIKVWYFSPDGPWRHLNLNRRYGSISDEDKVEDV